MRIKKTNQLYFGRYKYMVAFKLNNISAARSMTHYGVDRAIALRRKWLVSWGARVIPSGITETTAGDLHSFVDDIADIKQHGRLVIGMNVGYLYHSELDKINQLQQLPYIEVTDTYQCEPQCGPGEIKLKNNSFAYRSYFKSIADHNIIKNIFSVINRNGIAGCPSIAYAASKHANTYMGYISSGYFIDHNHLSDLTMLQLVVPDCIRKTVRIVSDK